MALLARPKQERVLHRFVPTDAAGAPSSFSGVAAGRSGA